MTNQFLQRTVFVMLFSFLLLVNAYSQNRNQYNLFTQSDNSLLNSTELQKVIRDADIFSINKEELHQLCMTKNEQITLNMPYAHNKVAKLNLKRFNVLSSDAKIIARTANGNEEVQLNDLAFSYTGQVEGLDNSFVTITFSGDNVTGLMVTPNDTYILGAMNDIDGHKTDNYILYKESDLKVKNSFMCATDDNLSTEQIESMKKSISKQMNDASTTDLLVARVAIEIDYITYNVYGGSVTNATNYAIALLAASSAIYLKEVNVKFEIPLIRVWTVQDPYTGTTSSALLTQFRNEWNANMQSVDRTVAHFITRRGGGLGGIAYVNALCGSYAYGFSGTDGPILPLPTYSWDVMVVTHEIGHNFGSPHTHSCTWPGGPIDSCYATEGGCYTGPIIPIVGTIMSYCHLSGSISLVKGFGPLPKAVVRGGAENAACVSISSRPVEVGYPNGGEKLSTGGSIPIYWGSSLTGSVNIELSLNNGSTWQSIQNNVPANQGTYNWLIPNIPSSLQSKIRIMDSSNPNAGDTTDASFKIALTLNGFQVLSPPALTRLTVSPIAVGSQLFTWKSSGSEPSIRYKFTIKKLSTVQDYVYVSNNNGADTSANVRLSFLDSVAALMGTVGDSVRCTWKAYAYNGIDSLSAANSLIITLIRTSVGINVITSEVPENFNLGNNYPNPFNPSTNIKFDIAKSTFAELKIFDLSGREVYTLVNEKLQPGSYEYNFDAANLPSGAYFYRLKTNEFSQTKRMVLIK